MKGFLKPRLYSEVNEYKSQEELDYSCVPISWGKQENYEILRKLGRGKYSDVYEGIDIINQKKVVIKILKPIKKIKILREIKILRALEGCNGVPRILDIVKEDNTKTSALIMDHCETQDIIALFSKLDDLDIRYYFYEMLRIIDFAHSRGIIHRDLKPSNILIDHPKRSVKIIDWGLAEFYIQEKPYNVRVASRYYKPPELLVNYQFYDYSLDMWSFGAMFAGIIFKKIPFFHGHDNYDQLVKIVRTLGTVSFYDYLDQYDISLDDRFEDLKVHYNPKSWHKHPNANSPLVSNEAIDLVSKLLVYDHNARLLPSEALLHPYFDPVRELLEQVNQASHFTNASDTLNILIENKLRN